MKWWWSRKNRGQGDVSTNGHAARQAIIDTEKVKRAAERRWNEVNQVSDEFTVALENALRRRR